MKTKKLWLLFVLMMFGLFSFTGCLGNTSLVEEELTRQVDKLMSENNDLKKENKKLSAEISALKGEKVDVEKEINELSKEDDNELSEDESEGGNDSKGEGTISEEEIAIENKKISETDEKNLVEDYIKKNIARLSLEDSIMPNSLLLNFEGIKEVRVDYKTTNNDNKRIRYIYKFDDSNNIELSVLGHYKKSEDGIYVEIEVEKDLLAENGKEDIIDEAKKSGEDEKEDEKEDEDEDEDEDEANEIPLVSNVKVLSSNTIKNKFFDYQVAFPVYWYRRNWGAVGNSLSHVGFSNQEIEEMKDEILSLDIVPLLNSGTSVEGDQIIIYKDRDDSTSYKIQGPKDYQDAIKTMLNSIVEIEEDES